MTENMHEETKKDASGNEDVRAEESMDTISQLFEDRDQDGPDRDNGDRSKAEKTREEKTFATQKVEEKPGLEPRTRRSETRGLEATNTQESKPPEKKSDLKEDDDRKNDEASSQPSLPEFEVLKKKLEKTEKILAENHKYGRSNAQKVKNALKVVQRFADDGLLAEEEAKELLGTLYSEGEEGTEDEGAYQASASQTSPFATIFKVANKELENILKYTDDQFLQDKVNAFDYFLSVGSKEEIEQVFEDLSDLLDDPLKLARKMLSIGQEVYEESYKGIREAGGFKNYLSVKDQEIEKLQKKIDKLEKKLLQYEDFDKPRYRIDETGSPGGDVESGKPANDTISALFEERDKVRK